MAIPEFKPSRAELVRSVQRTPEGNERLKKVGETMKQLREAMHDPEKSYRYTPPAEYLAEFYERLEKEYEALPMSKEEIEKNFSNENLVSLSTEEYVELLRRVPPRFVTHVTRQGIRDHVSHHNGGKGEFYNGFKGIIEKKKIQAILERYLEGVICRDTVKAVMEESLKIPEEYPTRKEAEQRIHDFMYSSLFTNLASSEMADGWSLHVAMEEVADEFYGGERDNELFFVYPTAFVAANNYVAPQFLAFPPGLKLDERSIGSQYNDFWIMNKKSGKGELSVDAALVFIPESTPVDKKTGSKYETDNEGKPVPNTEQIENLKKCVASAELKAVYPQLYKEIRLCGEIVGKIWRKKQKIQELENKGSPNFYIEEEKYELEKIEQQLEASQKNLQPLFDILRDNGVTDPRIVNAFFEKDFRKRDALGGLLERSVRDEPFTDDWQDKMRVDDAVQDLVVQYKLAENPISSQQYWEDYFEKTGQRPSKVIYYEQKTPNEALAAFRRQAGLNKNEQNTSVDLREMFQENLVSNQDIHDKLDQEREIFAQYAEEVLNEMYP